MFGHNKSKMRMKAMEMMMREKPSMPEKKDPMEVTDEMGSKGFVSMPVTEEEKAMILAMRKEKDGGVEMEEESEEEYA